MDNENFGRISESVCKILDTTTEDLMKDGKGNMKTYTARYFIEYVLIKKFNITYCETSKMVNRHISKVFMGVSIIKYGIEHDKYYIELWNKIKKELGYE